LGGGQKEGVALGTTPSKVRENDKLAGRPWQSKQPTDEISEEVVKLCDFSGRHTPNSQPKPVNRRNNGLEQL
jgi:hypothetical protein